MDRKEITAWELLRQASDTINEIVLLTATSKPEGKITERIQQALIVAMGAISIFSKHLADDDINGLVRTRETDHEGD